MSRERRLEEGRKGSDGGWWPSEEDGLISCGKGKGNWIKRVDSRDPSEKEVKREIMEVVE